MFKKLTLSLGTVLLASSFAVAAQDAAPQTSTPQGTAPTPATTSSTQPTKHHKKHHKNHKRPSTTVTRPASQSAK